MARKPLEFDLKQIDNKNIYEFEVSYAHKTDLKCYLNEVGGLTNDFNSEKNIENFIRKNEKEFLNLFGYSNGTVRYGKPLKANGLIPDLWFECDDHIAIFELKCSDLERCKSKTYQASAIGQLLLYKLSFNKPVKLFLVDSVIHKETALIVYQNELPITLIELKKDCIKVLFDGGLHG